MLIKWQGYSMLTLCCFVKYQSS